MGKNLIHDIISSYTFDNWKKTYNKAQLDTKHLEACKKAAVKHRLPADEQIYLLIDNSSVLSPQESCVLTSRGISIADTQLIGSDNLLRRDWNKLKSVEIINGKLVLIEKGGYKKPIDPKLILKNNAQYINEFIKILNEIILTVNKKENTPIIHKLKKGGKKSKKRTYIILIPIAILILAIVGYLLFSIFAGGANKISTFPKKKAGDIKEQAAMQEQIQFIQDKKTTITAYIQEAISNSDSNLLTAAQQEILALKWDALETIPDSINQLKKDEVTLIREDFLNQINELRKTNVIELLRSEEYYLDEGESVFSFALLTGDSLILDIQSENPLSRITVFEERTGKSLYSNTNVKALSREINIPHTDVINISLRTYQPQYCGFTMSKKPRDFTSKFYSSKTQFDTLVVDAKEKGATKTSSLGYKNIFNEPYKVTLNSSVSTFFGGEDRVIIPVNLPEKTVEWVYRIRISNVESDMEGRLFQEVGQIRKEFKIAGYTVWETSKTRRSLSREIMNRLMMPKVEEATCNVFFIENKEEALNFQHGKPFKYNLDYSILNTQSRNGLIDAEKRNFVYLGLENTKFRGSTYVWIEVVALIQEDYYYKIVRSASE